MKKFDINCVYTPVRFEDEKPSVSGIYFYQNKISSFVGWAMYCDKKKAFIHTDEIATNYIKPMQPEFWLKESPIKSKNNG